MDKWLLHENSNFKCIVTDLVLERPIFLTFCYDIVIFFCRCPFCTSIAMLEDYESKLFAFVNK